MWKSVQKVSGNIVKQLVDEGDFVKAGQPLFQIDPTQYRSAVEQARAAVNVAKASIATQELTVQKQAHASSARHCVAV